MRRFLRVFTQLLVVIVLPFGSSVAADKTLRLAIDALPGFLGHPYASTARPTIFTNSAIYDGLTRFDTEGHLIPWLATSWENVDELTWRFHLREGVTFSNGRPLTAQSIVTIVDWLTSPASLPDGIRGELPFLKSARVVDDLTAEVVTTLPVPTLPRYGGSLIMAEPVAFAELGRDGYAQNPIGTGPFQVEDWQATKITMTAFRDSWRPPKVDRVEILALPNISGRVQALLSGRVDVAVALGPDDKMVVETGGGVIDAWVDASVFAVSFITIKEGPLQDVRVRQALNYAVNRQAIIDSLFNGGTRLATQGVSHQAFGFNPDLEPYPYDPEMAKALLAEAGYENGFSFKFLTMSGIGSGALVYQQVAADLARVGVTMEIAQLPASAYFETVLRVPDHRGYDAHGLIWPAWPTFDALRPMLMHSCIHRPPWHCDREIQPLIDAALQEWDEERGLEMRREIMAYTRESAPAIFLHESPEYTGLSPRVTGYNQFHGYISYHTIDLTD